ncbi:MAG: non-reducing end alpha-L-arabinofuranosidase family hydrolase [Planctomycetaceae bacterium]
MKSCHCIMGTVLLSVAGTATADDPLPADFHWTTGPPVVEPAAVDGEAWHSVKDPTIVRHDGKWHLFVTVRGMNRSHAIVYLAFADWKDANAAPRHVLSNHDGYFCAPQVFFFTPHKKWYLICQAASESWEPDYQPAFATTDDVSDPDSWSKLTPLYGYKPKNLKGWIDFWVICDEVQAHLFYTSNDGNMWRSSTPIGDFPKDWSEPELVLDADVFEASHTYKLKGHDKYLTIVEAENGHGWRYYKAYVADRLDGDWKPLAATKDYAFASMKNVEQTAGRWTDAISHGELLRSGVDETLEVDPANLRFLFQGVQDEEKQGKKYGDISWKLGLLELAE